MNRIVGVMKKRGADALAVGNEVNEEIIKKFPVRLYANGWGWDSSKRRYFKFSDKIIKKGDKAFYIADDNTVLVS